MRIRIRGPLFPPISETRARRRRRESLSRARRTSRLFARVRVARSSSALARARRSPFVRLARSIPARDARSSRATDDRFVASSRNRQPPRLVAPPSVDARDAGVRRVRAGRVQTERWRRSSRRLRDGRLARRARCAPVGPRPVLPSRVPKFPSTRPSPRAPPNPAPPARTPAPAISTPSRSRSSPAADFPSPAQPPSRARRACSARAAIPPRRRSVARDTTAAPSAPLSDVTDPRVVANVLKLYLETLPEPLLTHRLYDSVLAAATIRDEDDAEVEDLHRREPSDALVSLPRRSSRAVVALRTLLERLDAASRRTLRVTLAFASRVALADAATATERRLGRRSFVGDSDGSTRRRSESAEATRALAAALRAALLRPPRGWTESAEDIVAATRAGAAHPPPRRRRPREDVARRRSPRRRWRTRTRTTRSGGARGARRTG